MIEIQNKNIQWRMINCNSKVFYCFKWTFNWQSLTLLTANYFCVPHFNPSNWIPPILLTTIEQLQLRDNRHIDWRNCNRIFILKSLPGIDSYLKIRLAWKKKLDFFVSSIKKLVSIIFAFRVCEEQSSCRAN